MKRITLAAGLLLCFSHGLPLEGFAQSTIGKMEGEWSRTTIPFVQIKVTPTEGPFADLYHSLHGNARIALTDEQGANIRVSYRKHVGVTCLFFVTFSGGGMNWERLDRRVWHGRRDDNREHCLDSIFAKVDVHDVSVETAAADKAALDKQAFRKHVSSTKHPIETRRIEEPIAFRLSSLVRLKLQLNWPSNQPVIQDALNDFLRVLKETSRDTLQVNVLPVGKVASPDHALDGVDRGELDAAWSTPSHHYVKGDIFALYSGGIPGGLDPSRFVSWVEAEGTVQINAFFSDVLKLSVRSIPCGIVGPGGEWFKTPVRELKGLKINAIGLAANVLQDLGAVPTSLAGGEIVPAIERGAIDGIVSVVTLQAAALRFPDAVKYLQYPSWTRPAQLLELLVNEPKWRRLPGAAQKAIEAICRRNLHEYLGRIAEFEWRGLKEVLNSGVTLKPYPRPLLEEIHNAALKVLDKKAKQDAPFARALASYNRYR